MTNKEKDIEKLKGLYKRNLKLLEDIANGKSKKKYEKDKISEFKNLNAHLSDYIKEIEMGLDCCQDVSMWIELFGSILMDDEELDDDNFPKGGW